MIDWLKQNLNRFASTIFISTEEVIQARTVRYLAIYRFTKTILGLT